MMRVLSTFVFMIGALAMVLAAVVVWFYLITGIIESTGWIAGILAVIASVWAWSRYDRYIRHPWQLWYEFWDYVDRRI
jgi:hypothetical protein